MLALKAGAARTGPVAQCRGVIECALERLLANAIGRSTLNQELTMNIGLRRPIVSMAFVRPGGKERRLLGHGGVEKGIWGMV